MSEAPTPGVAERDAVGRAETLTPEAIEAVLADFRAWLREAAAPPPAAPDAEAIDLHTLLAQFTALRHEVHLQTRAARAQQEQGAEALRQLGEALAALQQCQLNARLGEDRERDEALRPLLKTLVDTYDALSLAEREVRRVQETLLAHPEQPASAPVPVPEEAPAAPSFWARLVGLGRTIADQQAAIAALRRQLNEERQLRPEAPAVAGRERQMLASVLAGYRMSLQRVERALQQSGLQPIPTVGEPFDPESMEVLEVVTDSDRPSGEVVGEVRRGYRWRDRVFRFAQVRVAKS
jgi:molecular chaperone GrpE